MLTLLLAACLLDAYPTPTVRWDPAAGAVAYRIEYRAVGEADWHAGGWLPCEADEAGTVACPGVSHDVPAARAFWPAAPLAGVEYEFCVRARAANGKTSANCSNVIPICWGL